MIKITSKNIKLNEKDKLFLKENLLEFFPFCNEKKVNILVMSKSKEKYLAKFILHEKETKKVHIIHTRSESLPKLVMRLIEKMRWSLTKVERKKNKAISNPFTIGEFLKKKRKKQNISVKDVLPLFKNTNKETFKAFESGEQLLNIDDLWILTSILNVKMDLITQLLEEGVLTDLKATKFKIDPKAS